jgi:hypothetical protein
MCGRVHTILNCNACPSFSGPTSPSLTTIQTTWLGLRNRKQSVLRLSVTYWCQLFADWLCFVERFLHAAAEVQLHQRMQSATVCSLWRVAEWISVSLHYKLIYVAMLLSLTQENAVDLHGLGGVPNTRDWRRSEKKKQRLCQKHESVSVHDLFSTGRHLSVVACIRSLKPYLWTALTT